MSLISTENRWMTSSRRGNGIETGGASRKNLPRSSPHRSPQSDSSRRSRSRGHEDQRAQDSLGIRPVQHYQRRRFETGGLTAHSVHTAERGDTFGYTGRT